MKFLFLFMDGVGLNGDDPEVNPFATAKTPNLDALLDGHKMVSGVAPLETKRATLLAIDANMGVEGMPQSATGQAALLTGKNVPEIIGKHYGPKPNPPVQAVIKEGTVFSELVSKGYTAALLNAYPEGYFTRIESGRRMHSAIPLAVTSAGIKLKTTQDLYDMKGMAADFTGEGWRKHLGYEDTPVMSGIDSGKFLAKLSTSYDFAFFEFWPSDYAGHHQDHTQAIQILEGIDLVLEGLLEAWDDEEGLVLITSDHGNMEDLSTRRHTHNPVPALVIGGKTLRDKFTKGLKTLADVAPAIMQFYP